ncbi:MAG: hypothetical protein PF542_04115 [Nanoarchaeota archaeon]|jgi:hypothetical protein|nr:hypothetical protein [Nanoarchaeota archaeon]
MTNEKYSQLVKKIHEVNDNLNVSLESDYGIEVYNTMKQLEKRYIEQIDSFNSDETLKLNSILDATKRNIDYTNTYFKQNSCKRLFSDSEFRKEIEKDVGEGVE